MFDCGSAVSVVRRHLSFETVGQEQDVMCLFRGGEDFKAVLLQGAADPDQGVLLKRLEVCAVKKSKVRLEEFGAFKKNFIFQQSPFWLGFAFVAAELRHISQRERRQLKTSKKCEIALYSQLKKPN